MTCEPDLFSQGSEEWTPGSTEPGSSTSSSASPTNGAEECSPPTGPECPSTRTYETWALERNPDGTDYLSYEETPTLRSNATSRMLISSVAASPAKTSQSPGNDADSQEPDPGSSMSSLASSTLFDPDGYSWKTFPDCFPRTLVGTSESLLGRWPTSGIAWDTGFSTAASSECRSDDDACTSSEPSLTMILEEPHNVAAKYSLSGRAAVGILRRAHKRGRTLPSHLFRALEQVAQTTTTDRQDGS